MKPRELLETATVHWLSVMDRKAKGMRGGIPESRCFAVSGFFFYPAFGCFGSEIFGIWRVKLYLKKWYPTRRAGSSDN